MKPICKKCGGTIHGAECLLCELFSTHQVPDGHRPAGWPMDGSYAAAVHPDQVHEVQAIAKHLGVPTDFTSDGRPIFSSPKHKRDYGHIVEHAMTGKRMVDRNGSYSDT